MLKLYFHFNPETCDIPEVGLSTTETNEHLLFADLTHQILELLEPGGALAQLCDNRKGTRQMLIEMAVTKWLQQAHEIANRLRGYKTEMVSERRLLWASTLPLSDDFEVSCYERDLPMPTPSRGGETTETTETKTRITKDQ